ncbi:hypothetical protein IWX87_003738 [Polaromonas sp. CG_9.7]|uniref:hypothetical protein n=1 Tax=unclassified Polaromonas TaxID=2638319 RepID=UPI0018C92863|nr:MULTISPECIES: hypothetical protein [unclassified Polaromonas]MBG6073955.1 hypothetical protein [Polaromonas sp. CG_9.7]MBG6115944.1 hypothetical protein [Polaromonas sp. CG_9.2]MDH6183523.1 hypothetical protein [Polaromonas sp. CG_23.6]
MRTDQLWKRVVRPLLVTAIVLPAVIAPLLVLAVVQGPTVPVLVDGTVSSDTENIAFGGELTISTRVIDDTVFNGPTMLEMVIDFSRVKGQGKASGKKFTSEAQVIVHRPLLAFDEVEVIFPYTQGNDVHAARSAMVTISASLSAKSGIVLTSKIKKVPLV